MNLEHNLKKINILFRLLHKCIYCNKIEMCKPVYRCMDCNEYCHWKCYTDKVQPAGNHNKIMRDFVAKNKKKNINLNVYDDQETTATQCKDTNMGGFAQPGDVVYTTFNQRRCTMNPVLEELKLLFPEFMSPPFNGYFFGNSNVRKKNLTT